MYHRKSYFLEMSNYEVALCAFHKARNCEKLSYSFWKRRDLCIVYDYKYYKYYKEVSYNNIRDKENVYVNKFKCILRKYDVRKKLGY